MGSQRVGHDWATFTFKATKYSKVVILISHFHGWLGICKTILLRNSGGKNLITYFTDEETEVEEESRWPTQLSCSRSTTGLRFTYNECLLSIINIVQFELDCEEGWVPKNWCFWTVVLKTLESPLDCKEIQPVHSEGDQPWDFFGRNDAKAETSVLWPPHCKELTHWKRLWFWEGLGARGEGDDRGWDGWMASLTRWTWVWVNSGSWWWTGRPGVLWFMGSQRVGHDWATELNWWTFMYKSTYGHMLLFLLGKYLGVEWVDYMVGIS